ncbi:MAG: hypothetical protein L0G22_01060, partial [Propionibacteriaceae bacterium]|nr:hypothetical protein [Propionibacteriaceae bacterium]
MTTRNGTRKPKPEPSRWVVFGLRPVRSAGAVVREILAQEGNPLGPDGEFVGQILADAACQFLPTATVS